MEVPGKFTIAIDGCSSHQTHYFCVFSMFSSKKYSGFTKFVMRFSTFENEECLDSVSHIDFLKFVLSIFNKKLGNVVGLIGDSCVTDKAVADLLQTFLVGCYTHRFAAEDVLEN